MLTAGVAWGFLNHPNIFGDYAWRYMVGACSTPNFLMLLTIPFLPESPRFCVVKGKTDKAEQIFKRVAWWNRKPMFAASLKREDLDASGSKKSTGSISLLFSRKMIRSTVLVFSLWFLGVSFFVNLYNN